MAYSNYRNSNYGNNRKKSTKKSKYTESEKIAFKLGQEIRIMNTIKSDKNSRVKASFEKGLNGFARKEDTPLFAD